MPTDTDDIKLPTQPGSPTSEHGQMMFAMGQMVAQIKGLKEAQITANGRTGKIEERVRIIETNQSSDAGKEQGKEWVWKLLYAMMGLGIGILGAYLALHK